MQIARGYENSKAAGRVLDVRIGRVTRGFTVLEAVTVVVIIAIMAALLVPLGSSLVNSNRAGQTYDQLQRIYLAIVGDPKSGNFGYLGDVGTYPADLANLLSNPGATGWNGPYLNDPAFENGTLYDPFGNPIQYFYQQRVGSPPPSLPDYLTIISPGPDRGSAAGVNPTNSTYQTATGNADNIQYPKWTDNYGLLSYQHLGTVNYSIFNMDSNPGVNASVPACSGMYGLEVTSVPRGTADQYTFGFSPGSGALDLVQGLYSIRVLSYMTSVTYPVYQEQIAIYPGTTLSRTISLAGLNSLQTNYYVFTLTNNWGAPLQVSTTTGNVSPTILNSTTRAFNLPACMPIRVATSSGTVDSFTMPKAAFSRTYQKATPYNAIYTVGVRNTRSSQPQVFVIDQGVTIGVVQNQGSKRHKYFKVRGGNTVVIVSSTFAQLDSSTINGDYEFNPIN